MCCELFLGKTEDDDDRKKQSRIGSMVRVNDREDMVLLQE